MRFHAEDYDNLCPSRGSIKTESLEFSASSVPPVCSLVSQISHVLYSIISKKRWRPTWMVPAAFSLTAWASTGWGPLTPGDGAPCVSLAEHIAFVCIRWVSRSKTWHIITTWHEHGFGNHWRGSPAPACQKVKGDRNGQEHSSDSADPASDARNMVKKGSQITLQTT